MADQSNGRTHEPSLRELTAEIDGLEKLLSEKIDGIKELLKANDRRYEERFVATEEKTALAMNASRDAVVKAEAATEKRFDSVNEFRKTLADQAATFVPRQEYQSNHQSLIDKIEIYKENSNKEINSLKETRSEGMGKGAVWAVVLAVGIVIAQIIVNIALHMWKP